PIEACQLRIVARQVRRSQRPEHLEVLPASTQEAVLGQHLEQAREQATVRSRDAERPGLAGGGEHPSRRRVESQSAESKEHIVARQLVETREQLVVDA